MTQPAARLQWIDHLRTLVIVLVVTQHACVTYSHVGSWYVMSASEPGRIAKLLFIVWQAHMQSFFMGLMFFLAGHFAEKSLARRSPGAFLRESLLRLGGPVLFFAAAIHPFIVLFLNPWHNDLPSVGDYYYRYVTTGRFLSATGPLWFALALLIFCALLAAWRALRPQPPTTPALVPSTAPRARTLAYLALGATVATFLVRLHQPLGSSVLNFQLAYFPAYIVVFILGLLSARDGWLLPLAGSDLARRARRLTLIGGPVGLALLVAAGGSPTKETEALYSGGLNLYAFGLAAWETFTGLGLSLALFAWFSRRCNNAHPFATWLSDRAFAVYVLHTPVLIALTMLYRPLESANALALAALLTVTGLIASFLVADLARRIPGLRAVL